MATTIGGNGAYLEITISGVVIQTIPKRLVTMSVSGNYLNINYWGFYNEQILYSDCGSPNEASAEDLRTAVKNILIA